MKILLILFFAILASPSNAQDPLSQPVAVEEEVIVGAREKGASFIGGSKALQQYIDSNIRYPQDAIENKIEGKVIVLFAIEKDGSVTGVSVRTGISESIDKEAVRLISEMPKWMPGEKNGIVTKTWAQIPINFTLNTEE